MGSWEISFTEMLSSVRLPYLHRTAELHTFDRDKVPPRSLKKYVLQEERANRNQREYAQLLPA